MSGIYDNVYDLSELFEFLEVQQKFYPNFNQNEFQKWLKINDIPITHHLDRGDQGNQGSLLVRGNLLTQGNEDIQDNQDNQLIQHFLLDSLDETSSMQSETSEMSILDELCIGTIVDHIEEPLPEYSDQLQFTNLQEFYDMEDIH